MPFQKDGKRDYKREAQWEKTKKPKRILDRRKRMSARRASGLKPGDPREVDHKKPLSEGGSNDKSNLRITSRKTNAQKEVRRKRSNAK